MVRVIIELVPHGDETKIRTIGIAEIANDATGDLKYGNYEVRLKHAGIYFGKPGNWKTGHVTKHKRSLSPYHLVAKALASCGIK